MNRYRKIAEAFSDPLPSEAWLFAQAILGKSVPVRSTGARREVEERVELERLAQISPQHADELRKLESGEAEAGRSRESLIWAAGISTEADARLRDLLREEAETLHAYQQGQWYYDTNTETISEWNEADHPRRPKGTPEGGEFAPKGGGGGGGATSGPRGNVAGSAERIAPSQADPSRWYLPSDAKGKWLGAKGDSTIRLKTPVEANGKLVHEIQFTKGVPVLDKFALPGKTATIILTGDHNTDLRNAEIAWRNLNPGKDLPGNATFHHDLLHATEQTVTIDGKKTKVLVGKMQLIPTEINTAVFHQGTASVAKKYYQGLGLDVGAVARLAKDEARSAGKSSKIVARALGKIKPGKIAKGLAPLVGRSIVRAIPLVGTGLAVLEFADNVEAHGVGGAIARATPVLGDLIAAHDLGSELAKQIRDEADAAAGKAQRQLNEPSRRAWEQADQQAIAAYNDLAPQIKVTNPPQSEGGGGLVDPQEIAAAVNEYREAMQNANFKRNVGTKGFDFKAAAAHNKQQLRRRLERASQKRAPARRGSTA